MGADAQLPPDLWEQIRRIAAEEVAKYAASGPLRNATISDGGLTIQGGVLRALLGNVSILYAGPVGPALPDGTVQQGIVVCRGDGSVVLSMFDADTTDGVLRQALNWFDRVGNVVMADDTNSGQGIARPFIPVVFYPAVFGGSTSTTSTTFTTIWRASAQKQQPRLSVGASAAPTGTTGEIRVLVNGDVLGSVQSVPAQGGGYQFGPLPVVGAHMTQLLIEIQVRCVGAGSINVVPNSGTGFQS